MKQGLSREELLGIVHGMNTDELSQLIQNAPAEVMQKYAPTGITEQMTPGPEDGLESWNKLKIKVGKDNRPELITRHPQVVEGPPAGLKKAVPAYLEEQTPDHINDGEEAG